MFGLSNEMPDRFDTDLGAVGKAVLGGQKQRLAVATAMLSQKPLLVFDEPTSGLDYARMQEVARCARELADEGRVVLVVTHDREFLQCACDRVLEL